MGSKIGDLIYSLELYRLHHPKSKIFKHFIIKRKTNRLHILFCHMQAVTAADLDAIIITRQLLQLNRSQRFYVLKEVIKARSHRR